MSCGAFSLYWQVVKRNVLLNKKMTQEKNSSTMLSDETKQDTGGIQISHLDVGQNVYDNNGTAKGPGLKIGKDHKLANFLEKAIGKERKSPYAALQSIENSGLKFDTKICFKTVYNYLDNNLFMNISNKDYQLKRVVKSGIIIKFIQH